MRTWQLNSQNCYSWENTTTYGARREIMDEVPGKRSLPDEPNERIVLLFNPGTALSSPSSSSPELWISTRKWGGDLKSAALPSSSPAE